MCFFFSTENVDRLSTPGWSLFRHERGYSLSGDEISEIVSKGLSGAPYAERHLELAAAPNASRWHGKIAAIDSLPILGVIAMLVEAACMRVWKAFYGVPVTPFVEIPVPVSLSPIVDESETPQQSEEEESEDDSTLPLQVLPVPAPVIFSALALSEYPVNSLLGLPEELQEKIFSYCDKGDLWALACVCKAPQGIITAIKARKANIIDETVARAERKRLPCRIKQGEFGSSSIISLLTSEMEWVEESLIINWIGNVGYRRHWKGASTKQIPIPDGIRAPAVYLPSTVDLSAYADMRRYMQELIMHPWLSLSKERAREIAPRLGGIAIEATLSYEAARLLGDEGKQVQMHCIFQNGLNVSGTSLGCMPIYHEDRSYEPVVSELIKEYALANATTVLHLAAQNNSDLLVFNTGIGEDVAGFLYADKVFAANIDGLCCAYEAAKKRARCPEVIVPKGRNFNLETIERLQAVGIRVVAADKEVIAALAAREGLRVSENFAVDALSILGVSGPGFLWEMEKQAGRDDAIRAAYLTPCYALAYIPLSIRSSSGETQIAVLSEFMVADDQE